MSRATIFAVWLLTALAAGIGIGFFCGRGASPRQNENVSSSFDGVTGVSHSRRVMAADDATRAEDGGPTQPRAERVPSATVEVIYADDSGESDVEVTAAHAARREKRAAAREAKARDRRDFLLSLNLDLLTDEQRERHELYCEAVKTRDALRKEIFDLKAGGKEVPQDMQSRLMDAESILRAERDSELRLLREAALRASGLDDSAVRQLSDDLKSIDGLFNRP